MELIDAARQRHSVRAFTDAQLTDETASALRKAVAECNEAAGLHFQLYTNEPEAFQANKPEYGSIKNCRNYFALVAPKGMDEQVGYYGEKLVLIAQTLSVNSCWVALTYKKSKTNVDVGPGEKLYMVIALGYGQTQGVAHKSKSVADVSDYTEGMPEWYKNGVEAALLAPTAINQQKFGFSLEGDKVKAKPGLGFYTKVDLGIAKFHFELGADKKGIWI